MIARTATPFSLIFWLLETFLFFALLFPAMERPDIEKTWEAPREARRVAGTQSLSEAERIAEQYSLQGFETWITKKSQGGITLYEVWVHKLPDIFSASGRR